MVRVIEKSKWWDDAVGICQVLKLTGGWRCLGGAGCLRKIRTIWVIDDMLMREDEKRLERDVDGTRCLG